VINFEKAEFSKPMKKQYQRYILPVKWNNKNVVMPCSSRVLGEIQ